MKAIRRFASKAAHAFIDIKHIFSKDVYVFYWRGANDKNFGDQLNVNLFKYLGFNPIATSPGKAEIFAIGSILHKYTSDCDAVIAGSGFIKPPTHTTIKHRNVIALRGPRTGSYLGIENIPLCDPGILAKKIFGNFSKQYQIGIVPHFRDQKDSNLLRFISNNEDIKLIDILQTPEAVVKEIAQCQIILSSSLHGLVIADSYNIPAVWIDFDDRQEGGKFKYCDYHESIGITRKRIRLTANSELESLLEYAVKANPQVTEQKMADLENAYSKLRNRLIILRINRIFRRIKSTIL